MGEKKLMKFVYEDGENIKVLKGFVLKEDDFTYEIEGENSGDRIVLGKRCIVKVTVIGSWER